MNIFKIKRRLQYNESIAQVYWANGKEDDISLFYESGLLYNHDLAIAAAESDSLTVNLYQFHTPDEPPDHMGEILELRTDPEPISHSSAVWNALETQDKIASSGSRKKKTLSGNPTSEHFWNQTKIWSFIAGLIVMTGITVWSMKISGDVVDIIERDIQRSYLEQSEEIKKLPIDKQIELLEQLRLQRDFNNAVEEELIKEQQNQPGQEIP